MNVNLVICDSKSHTIPPLAWKSKGYDLNVTRKWNVNFTRGARQTRTNLTLPCLCSYAKNVWYNAAKGDYAFILNGKHLDLFLFQSPASSIKNKIVSLKFTSCLTHAFIFIFLYNKKLQRKQSTHIYRWNATFQLFNLEWHTGNMSSYAMCKCIELQHEFFLDVCSIPLDECHSNILSFDTLEHNVDNNMYIIYGTMNTHIVKVQWTRSDKNHSYCIWSYSTIKFWHTHMSKNTHVDKRPL